MASDDKRAEIGGRIQARKNQMGLSNKELAESIGVSRVTISLWEKGETALSAENLMKLSEVLQCNPIWIMTGTENPYSNVPPAAIAADDIIIINLIKLLPSIEKERIANELRVKVDYYNDLYRELKAARQQSEE